MHIASLVGSMSRLFTGSSSEPPGSSLIRPDIRRLPLTLPVVPANMSDILLVIEKRFFMYEIRFHGRGGQGAVMASEILALAAFREGKYPQSFPSFGLERRGAPVAAYLRVDDEKILIRQNIYRPDFVVVMDPTLLELEPTLSGLKPGGGILINSDDPPQAFKDRLGSNNVSIGAVPAGAIARSRGLGTELLPIINTTILGAVARMTNIVTLENLTAAICETIPKRGADNAEGAREAFDRVTILEAS